MPTSAEQRTAPARAEDTVRQRDAYTAAIATMTKAVGQLTKQIAEEVQCAVEYADCGNRNAAVGTIAIIEPMLQDAIGACNAITMLQRRARP